MRVSTLIVCTFAILSGLTLVSGTAEARSSKTLLILGIQLGGRPIEPIRRAVQSQLAHQGEEIVNPSRDLSQRELLCDQSECLTELSQREGAAVMLGGSILQSGHSYEIRLWLYDSNAQQTLEQQESCQNCNETQLQDVTAQTAGKLLLKGAEATCPQCPKCGAPSPVQTVQAPRQELLILAKTDGGRWRFGRGVAIGVFSGLLVASLTVGIVLNAEDGQSVTGVTGKVANLLPEAGLSYGLAGASVIGLAISLALPSRAEAR